MQEPNDEKLMQSYAAGSMEAFETLYRRHREALYRYLLRLVGDPSTTNDLYQASWEKVIMAKARYKPTAPFKAWLFRIAHNNAMDHFRRQKPDAGQVPEELPADESSAVEKLTADSRSTMLRQAVAALPPEQRDTLLLRLESGLDLKTIAEVTGVNAETAKSRLRYAVKRLKSELGDLNTSEESSQ